MPQFENADRWLWVIDEKLIQSLFPDPPPVQVETVSEPKPGTAPDPDTQLLWARANSQFESRQHEAALETYRTLVEKDPSNSGLTYNVALCLRQLGRYNEATLAFEKVIRLNPELDGARIGLAWCLLHMHRAERALAMLEQQLEETPGDTHAARGRAQALDLVGHHEEAAAAYRDLLINEPGNPDVLANLIAVSAQRDDLEGQRRYAGQLLQLRPGSRQALAGMLSANLADGDSESAVSTAQQFLKIEPKSYEAWFNLGLACQRTDRLEEAENAYRRAAELDPARLDPILNLGVVCMDRGEFINAQASFELVLSRSPRNMDALWNLIVLAERRGDLDQAAACTERLLADKPGDAQALFHRGYLQFVRNDWVGSIESFQACLSQRRDLLEARVYLAMALSQSGNPASAVAQLDQALQHDPIFVPALQCRLALALAAHDLTAAPELEAQLADLDHSSPEFCYNLGILQNEANQHEAAVLSYRRAVVKQPTFAAALINLGHTLSQLGRPEEAVEIWQNAISVKPDLANEYFLASA